MKNRKLSKILGIGLSLMLALSLGLVFTAAPVAADEDEWDAYDLPVAGEDGDWFMDDDIVTVGPIVRDIDGYFWAYVAIGSTTTYELMKSLDTEGRTWEATLYSDADDGVATGGIPIVAIVTSTLDADVVYIAADDSDTTPGDGVWKTEDGGDTWDEVGDWDEVLKEGESAGGTYEEISALAVGWDADDDPRVFAGTEDPAAGAGDDSGSVWYLYDIAFGQAWTDLALDIGIDGDDLDVYGIAVSPDFTDDAFQAVLVGDNAPSSSAPQTFLAYHVGSNPGGWNAVSLDQADDGDYELDAGSDPVFPSDFNGDDFYDADTEIFVGVAGDVHDAAPAEGGVYRVYGPNDGNEEVLDDVNTDIISLALVGNLGNAQILAGALDTANVWYSWDDGDNWESAAAEGINPAGAGPSYVVIDDDFDEDEGIGWAATIADEGGLHMTIDGGTSWQGIALLDTDILDLNAAVIVGDTVYILTDETTGTGGDSDLFRYDSGDDAWTRLFQEDQYALGAFMDIIGVFEDTIVLADSGAADMVFSTDGGQIFAEPDEEPTTIASLLLLDDETWWVGDDDGDLWVTDDAGDRVWDEYEIEATSDDIVSLAVSGDKALAGNDNSDVFYSEDAGETWDVVDTGNDIGAATPGATYVTFDSDDDNIAYAASDNILARFTDLSDLDLDWEAYDVDVDGAGDDDFDAASGIVMMDGVLYASSADTVQVLNTGEGAVLRIVNPLEDLDDVDESNVDFVDAGLTAGTDLFDGGLLATTGSTVLWAIDIAAETLWTYTDLMVGPSMGLDADPSSSSAVLTWDGFDNATDYEVWVYDSEDMRTIDEWYVDDTGSDEPVLRVNSTNTTGVNEDDDLDSAKDYWWQVRAVAPVHSKWSAVMMFTTEPGGLDIDEDMFAPPLGATDVSTTPSFAWERITRADSYSFEFSDTADFSNIIESASTTTPAYNLMATLEHNTNYFWRVKSVTNDLSSNWSTGTFTTRVAPVVAPTPPAPPAPPPAITIPPIQQITPNWIYAIIGIGAALAVLVIVLILKTRKP